MIKEYIKTVPIKAEQFNGSAEMIKKYGIESYADSGYGNVDFDYSLMTLEGWSSWDRDCLVWIATGVDGEHWVIGDDQFKKSYQDIRLQHDRLANYLDGCKLPVDKDKLAAKILEILYGGEVKGY